MIEIIEFLKQNIIFLIVPIIIIIMLVQTIILNNQSKKKTANWLEKYPNSIKLYVNSGTFGKYKISLATVNNQEAAIFKEGMKIGYYVLPNKNILGELMCEYTKHNIITKSKKIYTFGPIDLEAEFKQGIDYEISYSEGDSYQKEAEFIIKEL